MHKLKKKKLCPLKIGEIVYLKGVGFPENNTADGGESWEGVSGVVAENPAQKGAPGERMIYVRAFRPVLTRRGGERMEATFFFPEQVHREYRPWLRKHLKTVFSAQSKLRKLRDQLIDLLPE